MKLAILFIIFSFISIESQSQKKIFSDDFVKTNIVDRGYTYITYLDSNDKVDYFLVKKGVWFSTIAAIHNKGVHDNIIELNANAIPHNKYKADRYLLLNYEKQNIFHSNLLKIISNKAPEIYKDSRKGVWEIHHYVKDVTFERNPEAHKLDPEDCIIETIILKDKLTQKWYLRKDITLFKTKLLSNSVSQAKENGRRILNMPNSLKEELKNAEKLVEQIEYNNLSEAEKSNITNGYFHFYDSYWKNYGKYKDGINKDERDVFKYIFHGDFSRAKTIIDRDDSKNILEKMIIRGNWRFYVELYESFVLNYSAICSKYLPSNYDVISLSSSSTVKDFYGGVITSYTTDLGTVNLDPRFTSYFQKFYKVYADSFPSAIRNDTANFIKEHGCDCKAVNQLAENILAYINLNGAIQKSGNSLKGKNCDRIKSRN